MKVPRIVLVPLMVVAGLVLAWLIAGQVFVDLVTP